MEDWQLWHEMARESEKDAWAAEKEGCLRSSVSRYYYAAYQAMTALLLYRKMTPPENREAWSHDTTPILIREQLGPVIPLLWKRQDLASRLERLYKIRIISDYIGNDEIGQERLKLARKAAGYILKTVSDILPER